MVDLNIPNFITIGLIVVVTLVLVHAIGSRVPGQIGSVLQNV